MVVSIIRLKMKGRNMSICLREPVSRGKEKVSVHEMVAKSTDHDERKEHETIRITNRTEGKTLMDYVNGLLLA